MESFNGDTVRSREKVIRGPKREDSALLAGLQIYHMRPHLELGGMRPGEAAGITIEGKNKWLAMIQAAKACASQVTDMREFQVTIIYQPPARENRFYAIFMYTEPTCNRYGIARLLISGS